MQVVENVPLFSTARHSSSLRWSGKEDILLASAALVPKRLPRMGMEGIDLRVEARWGEARRRGIC